MKIFGSNSSYIQCLWIAEIECWWLLNEMQFLLFPNMLKFFSLCVQGNLIWGIQNILFGFFGVWPGLSFKRVCKSKNKISGFWEMLKILRIGKVKELFASPSLMGTHPRLSSEVGAHSCLDETLFFLSPTTCDCTQKLLSKVLVLHVLKSPIMSGNIWEFSMILFKYFYGSFCNIGFRNKKFTFTF